MIATIHSYLLRLFAKDHGARTLQYAGVLRFVFVLSQGIILVKAGVPVYLIGQIELVLFAAHFFMYFWQNGGNNAMLSWSSARNTGVPAAVLAGMHVFAACGVILFVLVALLIPGERYTLITEGWHLLAIATYVFFSIPVTALTYAWLRRQHYGAILWFTIVSYCVQLAIVIIPVIAGYDLSLMLTGLALFAVLRWLFVLAYGRWWSEGQASRTSILAFIVFAIPLVLHAFNSGIMDYVDGWIVSEFYGAEQFAQYRYGARELPLTVLLLGGLTSGLVHRFRSEEQIDTASLKAESLRIMHVLFPLTATLVLVSPLLYRLVYSGDFIISARIFNIYALTLVSRVVLNHVIIYAMRRPWVLTWSTVVEVLINVILSIILMRWMGLYGIPVATVIAYLLQRVFLSVYVWMKWQIRFTAYVPVKIYLGYLFIMCVCFYLSEIFWY